MADIERAASVPAKYRIFFTMLAFGVVSIGGAVLIRQLKLGWIGPVLFMLLLMIMIVVLIRVVDAAGMASGCASPAIRRYNRRMLFGSLGYMVALFAAVWAFKAWHLAGPVLWPVAMLPSFGVLFMVWAMARLLIEEHDEYLRFRMVKQALFATGGLLALGTVWGFFEQFALVPHVPSWAVVPVFAVFLGVGQCFKWVRA